MHTHCTHRLNQTILVVCGNSALKKGCSFRGMKFLSVKNVCRYAHETEWLGLMDVDEFLIPVRTTTVTQILSQESMLPHSWVHFVVANSVGLDHSLQQPLFVQVREIRFMQVSYLGHENVILRYEPNVIWCRKQSFSPTLGLIADDLLPKTIPAKTYLCYDVQALSCNVWK